MADPMTPEHRAEIRARVDATTSGPWTVRDLYVIAPGDVHIADFEWLADGDEEWAEFQANAVFVAAARQDVPALVDEVEQLRAALAEVKLRTVQRDLSRLAHTALYGTKEGGDHG